jgi:hypothetical protein
MPIELLDRTDAVGLVTCPNCRVTMRRIVMKPVKRDFRHPASRLQTALPFGNSKSNVAIPPGARSAAR